MKEQLRISAKNLGELALPEFCPRCFWLSNHASAGLPFKRGFPGIFSSIDSYSKRVVHGWFDNSEKPPPWLAELGELAGYIKPPHHSKFYIVDNQLNIMLTGDPDGILIRDDDSKFIIDYKTAKFTAKQDELFPMYEVQLNAYALIAEKCGFSPISGLALIYTEPITDAECFPSARVGQNQSLN